MLHLISRRELMGFHRKQPMFQTRDLKQYDAFFAKIADIDAEKELIALSS